ncbi:MAG TPA: hypothetical protein VFE65_05540 [Pseudonocardia sp.]|jgi:hypothetical protein|nr:hypothetical protein [Pseudonocardia sp.]
MTSPFSSALAAVGLPRLAQGAGSGQDVTTNNLQHWISGNIVPLLLLVIAVVLLWIGGRGDNAGVARRSISLVVGLVVLGIAMSGKADKVGQFFAQLIIG